MVSVLNCVRQNCADNKAKESFIPVKSQKTLLDVRYEAAEIVYHHFLR